MPNSCKNKRTRGSTCNSHLTLFSSCCFPKNGKSRISGRPQAVHRKRCAREPVRPIIPPGLHLFSVMRATGQCLVSRARLLSRMNNHWGYFWRHEAHISNSRSHNTFFRFLQLPQWLCHTSLSGHQRDQCLGVPVFQCHLAFALLSNLRTQESKKGKKEKNHWHSDTVPAYLPTYLLVLYPTPPYEATRLWGIEG